MTALERETVVLLSDADEYASVVTHQRKFLTKLDRNPLAEKIEDLTIGLTKGAEYRIPAWAISFRTKKQVRGSSAASHLRPKRPNGMGVSGKTPAVEGSGT